MKWENIPGVVVFLCEQNTKQTICHLSATFVLFNESKVQIMKSWKDLINQIEIYFFSKTAKFVNKKQKGGEQAISIKFFMVIEI